MGKDETCFMATMDTKHTDAMGQPLKLNMQEENKASSQDERKKLFHQHLKLQRQICHKLIF